ncbi:hypothetical protein GCM10009574_023600 [Streptomyces asiaticus]
MPRTWTDPRYLTLVTTLRALRECTGRPIRGFVVPKPGTSRTADDRK